MALRRKTRFGMVRKTEYKNKKDRPGTSGPMLKHSYNNTLSVFRTEKEKTPLYSVTSSGEYKISVLKLILILIGIVSFLALAIGAAKKIRICRHKRIAKKAIEEYTGYENDLPF